MFVLSEAFFLLYISIVPEKGMFSCFDTPFVFKSHKLNSKGYISGGNFLWLYMRIDIVKNAIDTAEIEHFQNIRLKYGKSPCVR